MVYKLHGAAVSTCTQRVLITAAEVGVDVELVPVDFSKGEHKSPEHIKHQPFGQVPYLEDTETGKTMHESRAISRYIAAKAKASHVYPVPSEPDYFDKLAAFETAASIETANFDPFVGGIAWEVIFKPRYGMPADKAAADVLAQKLSGKLDGYERILSKQPFLAGQNITLADLFHAPYGNKLFEAGYGELIESRPNVAKWWKQVRAHPSVTKVLDA